MVICMYLHLVKRMVQIYKIVPAANGEKKVVSSDTEDGGY